MSLLGWKQSKPYILICEIGSGSVLFSIIDAKQAAAVPTIVWSYREIISDNITPDLDRTTKKIASAAMNAGMVMSSEGMKALYEYDHLGQIMESYITLAAPWSFTVSKTVRCTSDDEEPFLVQKNTLTALVETAISATKEEFLQQEKLRNNVSIINHSTVAIKANGYPITNIIGKRAMQVELSHLCALAQTPMVDFISDVHHKLLPELESELLSFMMVYYLVIRDLYPGQKDFCLLDITNEASELGIVRDGELDNCSHIMTGSQSLAHTLSRESSLPLETIFAFMHDTDDNASRYQHIPKDKHQFIESALTDYQADLQSLFSGGDETAGIPRTIYLHCDHRLEGFYDEQLRAALQSTKLTKFNISLVTKDITSALSIDHNSSPTMDTAAQIAAYFFHTKRNNYSFLSD